MRAASGRPVAGPRALVREGLAGDRQELPAVAGRRQRQVEDAVGLVVLLLAVRQECRAEKPVASTARPHDELADPMVGVSGPVGLLRREPLVVVLVAAEDQGRAPVVEGVPERSDRGRAGGAAEERMMEVSKGALVGVGGEVAAEPGLLRRASRAGDRRALGVRVEGDHVPRADVVAVVALVAIAERTRGGSGALEVVEIARRARGVVLAVPGRGEGAALERSPLRVVPRVELVEGPVLVRVVAEGRDRPRSLPDQVAGRAAVGP